MFPLAIMGGPALGFWGAAMPAWAQEYPGKPEFRAMLTGWYTADRERLDAFVIRRVYLRVSGELSPTLDYTAYFQPSKMPALPLITLRTDESGRSTATAEAQGDSSILQDVYARYRPFEGLTVLLGQFRPPLSVEARHPSSQLPLAQRALFLERNPFGFYYDQGIEASYALNGLLTIRAGVFNGEGTNQRELDEGKDAVLRLDLSPLPGLALGAAYLWGSKGAASAPKDRLDLNAEWRLGPVQFNGEALWGRDAATTRLGWYGQASWRLGGPYQLVGRYEGWDADLADAERQQNGTLGLNYWIQEAGTKIALNLIQETYWGARARTNEVALLQYQLVL